ncbi:MAG: DsbA family protein [Rickettsiales bacterium]
MTRALFLAFITTFIASPLLAADDNPVVHKNDIPKLVREYLMEHPEVIMESVQQAQVKAQEAEQKESAAAVARFKSEIFADKNAPALGKPDAKVTIAEFYDYNCSACKFMFQGVSQYVKEGLPEDVRIVFKEFPIFGEQSEMLARMAIAVNRIDKDKFFAFHSGMMGFKGHPTDEQISELLKSIGLDMAAVKKEADSDAVKAIVEKNKQLGIALKIGGTPFVVVNDQVTPHAMDYATLKAAVEQARK